MLTREMTDQEFQLHALSILQRELGDEGYARFVRFLKSDEIDEVVEMVREAEAGEW